MDDNSLPRTAPRPRHDGWTPERRARFLVALEATGSVRAAVATAGMGRASAYRLRDRPGTFGRRWDMALARWHTRTINDHWAKATRALRLLDKGDDGDRRVRGVAPRKSDEGDRSRENSPRRQLHQPCLPRALDTRRPDDAALWAIIDRASR